MESMEQEEDRYGRFFCVGTVGWQKKNLEEIPQALYMMAYLFCLFQQLYAAFFFFDAAFSALRFSASWSTGS